jgi:hypothetical protein
MYARESSPLTDSPWFWVVMFSLMAVGALVAIGGKYGRRQAGIERQYQARTRVAEQWANDNNSAANPQIDSPTGSRGFAAPGDTLIPLWPLAVVLLLVSLFAAIMLARGRGLRRAQPSGQPGSVPSDRSSP